MQEVPQKIFSEISDLENMMKDIVSKDVNPLELEEQDLEQYKVPEQVKEYYDNSETIDVDKKLRMVSLLFPKAQGIEFIEMCNDLGYERLDKLFLEILQEQENSLNK